MITKVLGAQSPYKLWYDVKPHIDHLIIFGSPCYVLQLEVKRMKLDHKTEVGIFIGYISKSKGYKIYDINITKLLLLEMSNL